MEPLANKRVLVGVTGSIAAYKAAELVRLLREAGAEVRVVMTRAATEFLGPLTLQALSGMPVRVGLWDAEAEAGMDHIALARWAEVLVVAPASADFLARLAQGRADDLLATLCLATRAPIAVVPAMNREMWANAATQANRRVLEQRGVAVWGPAAGEQACGEIGWGRMIEPDEIVQELSRVCSAQPLAGLRVLITAGPTREEIDPVRFIGNRSSGKMGYAVARAAREAGAEVTLVSGPVALPVPVGVERVAVETAAQMLEAVAARIERTDLFIAAAAVADYRPVERALQKLKKGRGRFDLALEPTPDVLAWVGRLERRPFLVGFAAETEDVQAHARVKLRSKGTDMVAANRVGAPGQGFEADDNALWVVWEGGEHSLGLAPKLALARQLIALVGDRYHARTSGTGADPRSAAG